MQACILEHIKNAGVHNYLLARLFAGPFVTQMGSLKR
jgi:hypothetical protein